MIVAGAAQLGVDPGPFHMVRASEHTAAPAQAAVVAPAAI